MAGKTIVSSFEQATESAKKPEGTYVSGEEADVSFLQALAERNSKVKQCLELLAQRKNELAKVKERQTANDKALADARQLYNDAAVDYKKAKSNLDALLVFNSDRVNRIAKKASSLTKSDIVNSVSDSVKDNKIRSFADTVRDSQFMRGLHATGQGIAQMLYFDRIANFAKDKFTKAKTSITQKISDFKNKMNERRLERQARKHERFAGKYVDSKADEFDLSEIQEQCDALSHVQFKESDNPYYQRLADTFGVLCRDWLLLKFDKAVQPEERESLSDSYLKAIYGIANIDTLRDKAETASSEWAEQMAKQAAEQATVSKDVPEDNKNISESSPESAPENTTESEKADNAQANAPMYVSIRKILVPRSKAESKIAEQAKSEKSVETTSDTSESKQPESVPSGNVETNEQVKAPDTSCTEEEFLKQLSALRKGNVRFAYSGLDDGKMGNDFSGLNKGKINAWQKVTGIKPTMIATATAWNQLGFDVDNGAPGIRSMGFHIDGTDNEARNKQFKYTALYDISQTNAFDILEGDTVESKLKSLDEIIKSKHWTKENANKLLIDANARTNDYTDESNPVETYSCQPDDAPDDSKKFDNDKEYDSMDAVTPEDMAGITYEDIYGRSVT